MFLIPSIVGILIFMIPVQFQGTWTIMVKILAEDATGSLEIVFFRASYMASSFKTGELYNIYGKVTKSGSTLQMVHPGSFEPQEQAVRRILPVYRTAKGITQKDLRNIAEAVLAEQEELAEVLPPDILEKRRIAGRAAALRNAGGSFRIP